MNAKLLAGISGLLLAAAVQPASALSISFDYSYDTSGFFSAARRTVLNDAAQFFDSHLGDNLTAITSSGPNDFTAKFADPSTGGSVSLNRYDVAANQLVVYVGARDLSGSALAQGGPGAYSVRGTQAFVDNAQSRGQAGALSSPPTDFGPWGGDIAFDSTYSWYTDPDPSTTEAFSGFDLYSVALHELGHVLGIGTAGSWDTWVSGGQFTGPAAEAVYGGPVPLNSAHDHWAKGTMSTVNGVSQQAAMDPAIAAGQRRYFTRLDMAGLSDVGWQVRPVPLPAPLALFGSGLVVLTGLARRRRAG